MRFPGGNVWGSGGPALTLAIALVILALRGSVVTIPNPPAFLVLAVVLSAFLGGTRPGLLSAAVAWAYTAYHFATPGEGFGYTVENFWRVLVWAFAMPAIAALVGTLHRRSVEKAQQKVEETESSLAKERDFTAALLDTVSALVVVLDADGKIVRFNRAAEHVTGYRFEEVRGKAVWDFPKRDRPGASPIASPQPPPDRT